MNYVPSLLKKGTKVIDLSADFRFEDKDIWQRAYGESHKAPDLLAKSVYGLPEYNSEKIKNSELIAVPGCYPTASILGILPLIEYIQPQSKIILDVKSGISGAGRSSVESELEKELKNNFKAYSPEFHRHQPEIKAFLSSVKGSENEIIFTPHLLPLFRGEYVTAYIEIENFKEDLNNLYENYYNNCEFVRVLKKGTVPELKKVQNTNFCDIGVFENENCVVIHSAIDNLVKGAAGQAIQCFNLLIGEKEGYILN
jgi:N-acetyl-gamma-glutamyl-phosphate reductase